LGEEDGGGGNNARTDGSLSLEGEGWGEGETCGYWGNSVHFMFLATLECHGL